MTTARSDSPRSQATCAIVRAFASCSPVSVTPEAGSVQESVGTASFPSASQARPTTTTSVTRTTGHHCAGRSLTPLERRREGRRRGVVLLRVPATGRRTRTTVRGGGITVDCRGGGCQVRGPDDVAPDTSRCRRPLVIVTVGRLPRRGALMADQLLPGITATRVETPRLSQQVLAAEGTELSGPGETVLFVHGNVSSSLFWQQPLLALAETGRVRAFAVDLRGFGGTDPLPIDAARGMGDWADDLAALVDTLGLDRVHLVGWSMGGGVVLQYLLDHPERVASVTLVAPVSPYGFGGTVGADGRRVHADGTGSGAGGANPEFVAAIAADETAADSPMSPRSVLRAFYVAPGSLPLDPRLEDVFVASMNSTRTGEDHYPGDAVPVEAWPGLAPGGRGVLNTMSPTAFDVSGITELAVKPPVLWIRGDADQIVSDTSVFDLAFLGSVGEVPGWPGKGVFPPQPMVTQTRAVLDRYAASGGRYREVLLPGVGHSPHVERPQEFTIALLEHLTHPAAAPSNTPETPSPDEL